MEEEEIKILIAEDHAIVRMGYRLFFENHPNIKIIGEVENGEKALQFLEKKQPHILLMDHKIPIKNNSDALSVIKQKYPFLKVIIISIFNDIRTVKNLIKQGARGYLSKNASEIELLLAIKAVKSGKKFFSSDVIELMMKDPIEVKVNGNLITKREKEIVELIKKGFTSREIADKLFISLRTVECHRVNIFRKLKVKNVIELLSALETS